MGMLFGTACRLHACSECMCSNFSNSMRHVCTLTDGLPELLYMYAAVARVQQVQLLNAARAYAHRCAAGAFAACCRSPGITFLRWHA